MSDSLIGKIAPNAVLKLDTQEAPLNISELKGKICVLYFYPKDMTPGCTIQAKDFRDTIKEFEKLDAVIIGISKDTIKKHLKFREKYALPFPLASDEDGTVCQQFHTWKQKSMFGKKYMGIERSTFIINKNNEIVKEWRKVSISKHVAEVLKYIKEEM